MTDPVDLARLREIAMTVRNHGNCPACKPKDDFIATFNPATVLALLDMVVKLRTGELDLLTEIDAKTFRLNQLEPENKSLLDEIDRLNSFIVACDRADLAIEIDRLKADEKELREELESTRSRAASTLARLTESHKELREENSRLKVETLRLRSNLLTPGAAEDLLAENEALRERVKELGG